MPAHTLKSGLKLLIAVPSILFVAALLLLAPVAKAAGATGKSQPAIVIDVRTPAEFAAGHIRGAINIPLDHIGEEIQTVEGIGKDSPILLYCRSGSRSERARRILIQQGYKQVNNGGGLEEMAQKLPSCAHTQC